MAERLGEFVGSCKFYQSNPWCRDPKIQGESWDFLVKVAGSNSHRTGRVK